MTRNPADFGKKGQPLQSKVSISWFSFHPLNLPTPKFQSVKVVGKPVIWVSIKDI